MEQRPYKTADAVRAALLVGPILPQGIWLRMRTPTLPEPFGPRQGTVGSGPGLKLLILGDSSAAGVGVRHQRDALAGQFVARLSRNYRVTYRLEARTGATTACAIESLEKLPARHWDVVLTGLGINDVKNGVGLPQYAQQTATLYDTLRSRFKARLIIASGMPPVRDFPLLTGPLRWAMQNRADLFDATHREIVEDRPFCHYLQGPERLSPDAMAHDGFHPAEPVYAEWADLAHAAFNQRYVMNRHRPRARRQ